MNSDTGREQGGEPPQVVDDILSLAEAAEVSGICAHTLAQQAEKGKLRGRKVGRTWLTTRQWLAEYVRTHARQRAGGAATTSPADEAQSASP